jgi:hypothetical protein
MATRDSRGDPLNRICQKIVIVSFLQHTSHEILQKLCQFPDSQGDPSILEPCSSIGMHQCWDDLCHHIQEDQGQLSHNLFR